ncbi:SDR family oxidoreductase [Archangium violaceum]|uniref:SDR family oxidoreductase n=1 Tax=Archangium violaceum TaxID=83451 RepID=UPI00194EFA84|nr:SDR family oxidoreductase [Archangium violaceum]QRN96024.1 SDR family oxidoreductase [Archangium violaceum]
MRVLVTGASRGIGLELVTRYLARGDEVVAAVRDPEGAEELRAHASSRLHVVAMDVGSTESVRAAAARCPPGPLHVLINNAALNGGPQRAPGMDLERAARILDVNAAGPMRVYDAFIERVRAAEEPRVVVNVSSDSGSLSVFRVSGKPEYAMSKAALNALTRWQAAQEPRVICVSLHPGWARTAMGGDKAPDTADVVAERMVAAISRLRPEHSGLFLDTELRPLPW